MDNENYKIINGDSLKVLDTLEENSIDAIITDPPYGLTSITKRFGKEGSAPNQYGRDGSFARLTKGFMGKEWDGSGIEYNVDLWSKALRVLKPGGYLLAFGGTRTYHRIACAIEDAGFEIRDCIMWIYGSGFPKSTNIGLMIDKKNGVESIDTGISSPNARPNCTKDNTLFESGTVGKDFTIKKANNEWDGWGTSLKPAYEPIIVARKPFRGSLVDNVLEWGVGALNIDECRVGDEELHNAYAANKTGFTSGDTRTGKALGMFANQKEGETVVNGRFPANLIHDGSEEATSGMPYTKNSERSEKYNKDTVYTNTYTPPKAMYNANNTYGDEGSAARYFYCAKASSKDRDEGLDDFEAKQMDSEETGDTNDDNFGDRIANVTRKNIHPTVKPTELMQYLVRLVCPKGATILDIFNGSGSTGKAVAFENRERNMDYKYIGIELDPEYCKISEARIAWAAGEYVYSVETDSARPNKEKEEKLEYESLW